MYMARHGISIAEVEKELAAFTNLTGVHRREDRLTIREISQRTCQRNDLRLADARVQSREQTSRAYSPTRQAIWAPRGTRSICKRKKELILHVGLRLL